MEVLGREEQIEGIAGCECYGVMSLYFDHDAELKWHLVIFREKT